MSNGGMDGDHADEWSRGTMFRALGLLVLLLGALVWAADGVDVAERYRVDPMQVDWNLPALGPTAHLAERSLDRMILSEIERSLFDADLGFAARQLFESNPWVRRVVSVSRVFPRGLSVELEFREAWANVDRDGYFLLCDRDGELLPSLPTRKSVLDPPMITARRVEDEAILPRGFSEIWFADAVREGAAVLAELEKHQDHNVFETIGIVGIDVSNYRKRLDPGRSEVRLVTNRVFSDEALGVASRPVVVRWGRSAAHAMGRAELSVSDKLDNLEALLQRNPGLSNVAVLDVRFDRPFWRSPAQTLAKTN